MVFKYIGGMIKLQLCRWTIDKKITNIDGSHNLEKRTKVPLRLSEAHAVALKYARLGHIIEYRKVSAEA